MKQLPIKLRPAITSECWTYNRTCIIETDPSGPEWVASHYTLFMHSGGHISFGDGFDKPSMSYYDILEHQCVPLEQYGARELIQRFEQWIDEGYYVIVDVNLGDLVKDYKNFKVHEILLYGYDEQRRVFYSPLQNERNGQFESFELEYDVIPPAIESVVAYYREAPLDRFERFFNFFYPLSKLKIIPIRRDDNMFILRAFKKLEAEYYYSNCLEISRYGQKHELEEKLAHYTGLGCLIGMREMLSHMIEGAETTPPHDPYPNIDKVTNLFTLYEHRCIMRSMLELLREKLDIDNEAYNSAFETYCSGIASMRESYLLMKKSQISGKLNSLPGIIQRLDVIYESDYDSLRIMDDIAREKMSERL
ncbi:MAG: hypothetical protein LBK00_10460 [Treponema sp.]|jgi:hypothetical protein|nr:hypothetical protein [Treponema sp.]